MISIRSISDLKQADRLIDTDLFQISRSVDGKNKYSSMSVSKEELFNEAISASMLSVATKYDFGEVTSVSNIKQGLDSISSVMQVEYNPSVKSNTASFPRSPISKGQCITNEEIPNREQVIGIINEHGDYVNPASYVKAYPHNHQGQTVWDENLYIWHIDNGQNDSGEYVDENGQKESDGKQILENGFMTIYGWLGSNETVTAQEAWVGLFTKVQQGPNRVSDWIAVQIQPWIIGKNSQVMQYVGFNVPVGAGSRWKIMTGFKVNGYSSGTNSGRTLMFNDVGNIPNTFVGYVFQNN